MGEMKLKLIGDGSDLIRTLGDVDEALGDVVDELLDVAKAGDRVESELDRNMTNIARDAKRGGDKAGDNLKRGLKDGVDDAKGELNSSGKEAAASFSGGFDDITSLLQEVAANAFEGFGPAGAAGGLLAAAGIGIATALFGQAEEKRAQLEEKAGALATAYIEAGTTVLDQMAIASRIAEVATSTDPADKANLKDLTDALGDRALALRVLAGDTEGLATAQGILDSKRSKLPDDILTGSGKRKSAVSEEAKEVEQLTRLLDEQAGIQSTAAQTADDYSDALLQMVGDAGEASVQVDELGNQLITLPNGVQVVIDAETGTATTNLDNFEGNVDTLPKTHVTDVEVAVNMTAWDRAIERITAWDPNKTIDVKVNPKFPQTGNWRIQELGG